jgi:hypothetical protein
MYVIRQQGADKTLAKVRFDIARPIKMGAEILSELSLCATFGFGDYLPL